MENKGLKQKMVVLENRVNVLEGQRVYSRVSNLLNGGDETHDSEKVELSSEFDLYVRENFF